MRAKDIAGLALIALALGLVGGGFYVAQSWKRPKADPQTLCALSGPSDATSILIDKTDPLAPAEQALVRAKILKERDGLAQGAQISVLLLQENPQTKAVESSLILRLCNPGSDANPLFENPKRVRDLYAQAFEAPLQQAIDSALAKASAPASPIAATVAQMLDDESLSHVAHPRLVLISDLMEHTPAASAYEGSFTEAALERAIGPEARARLGATSVEMVVFPRPKLGSRQAQAQKIWMAFFEKYAAQTPALVR